MKKFNVRLQNKNRYTAVRKFTGRRWFIRATARCLRAAYSKSTSKHTLKLTPLKNIVVDARTVDDSERMLDKIVEPSRVLIKSPQEIIFSTFFRRRIKVLKTQIAAKMVERDPCAQLYQLLRKSSQASKHGISNEATAVKTKITPNDATVGVVKDAWKGMLAPDKRDFNNKTSKFKNETVLNQLGVKKLCVTQSKPPHSKNWIPPEQWKRMPRKAKDSFLERTGKLKHKVVNVK